eukprot:scaffold6974_cov98-Isochrysis_galbana.AAC.2
MLGPLPAPYSRLYHPPIVVRINEKKSIANRVNLSHLNAACKRAGLKMVKGNREKRKINTPDGLITTSGKKFVWQEKGHWQVPETGHGPHRRSFQDLRQIFMSPAQTSTLSSSGFWSTGRRKSMFSRSQQSFPTIQPYADWLCPLHADSRPIQSLGEFLRPTATQTFPSSQ